MRRLTVSGDRYVFLFIISLFLRDDYFLSIHNIDARAQCHRLGLASGQCGAEHRSTRRTVDHDIDRLVSLDAQSTMTGSLPMPVTRRSSKVTLKPRISLAPLLASWAK